jgi:general secretion pathway protein A
MLQEILHQLEVEVATRNRQSLVQTLHETLIDYYEKGRRVVILIDEAHLIKNASSLEELRLLLNCQMNDQFLISLLLLGQPELKQKIAKVPALEQRLAVRHVIKPLDVQETGEMVLHRLRVAGFSGEKNPFSPDAIYELHRFSGGAPRVVCQLADNAMVMAMARNVAMVDGMLIHEVAEEYSGGLAA